MGNLFTTSTAQSDTRRSTIDVSIHAKSSSRRTATGSRAREGWKRSVWREIMILRAWGEMTFEEAAAVLDISPNTAASRYRYALAKLKERLKPLAKE
jgi:hypothetical protein